MLEWLAGGGGVDVALGAVAVEALILVAYRARTGRGLAPVDVLGQLLAGALLLVALRLALGGADARLVLLVLAASLPAHAFDLARRARAV